MQPAQAKEKQIPQKGNINLTLAVPYLVENVRDGTKYVSEARFFKKNNKRGFKYFPIPSYTYSKLAY